MCACVQHRSQYLSVFTLSAGTIPLVPPANRLYGNVWCHHTSERMTGGGVVCVYVLWVTQPATHTLWWPDRAGRARHWNSLRSAELSLSLPSHKTYWILWFRKSCLPELINFAWKHCSIWFTAPSGFINLLEQSNKTNSTTLLDALLRCDGAFMSHSAINKQAIRIEWNPGCILA